MASSLEMIRKQRRALQTAQGEASAADIKEAKETDKRERPYYLSSEVRFYGVAELMDMLGWSKHTVLRLFGDPEFPAVDFGKRKVVESHALIEYFSRRRIRDEEPYWHREA